MGENAEIAVVLKPWRDNRGFKRLIKIPSLNNSPPILGKTRMMEEEMEIHSSIFAWKIPWTEEPGMLQSTGSQ